MKSTGIIKSLRSKRNLSQGNVADMLGIARQTYNSLENDLLNNDYMLSFKILEVLKPNEIETDEFFNALKQDYMSYIVSEKEE
ncbi:MAG: helix-turn-helix domain-containing protein [Bacillota bacterium]|nr:helix-turn-helix domain-containing protein [Bacillota bacterium]